MKMMLIFAVALSMAMSFLTASAKESHPKTYLEGTVLHIDKLESSERVQGENPSDAPMPDPENFAYNVAVRVSCGTYVGRYQSWYNYVPSILAPNQKIQLRLTRSAMYVPVPNQKEIEMSIVSKHQEPGPCEISKR